MRSEEDWFARPLKDAMPTAIAARMTPPMTTVRKVERRPLSLLVP
jgi:hypothetical protein